MRLTLTDNDGTVLDTVEVEREELVKAQGAPLGAMALLSELFVPEGTE